jgi:hypothetical protein
MTLDKDANIDEAVDKVWDVSERESWEAYDPMYQHRDARSWERQLYERLRAVAKGQLVMSLEELSDRTGMYADYAQFDDSDGYFIGDLKRIDSLTASAVDDVVENGLTKGRAIVVTIRPKKGAVARWNRAPIAFKPDDRDQPQLPVDPAEAEQPLPIPDPPTMVSKASCCSPRGRRCRP